MIKVEKIEVWGFRHAIRGMRNPLNSWDKSDSYETHIEDPETLETAPFEFFVGENDLALMRRLFKGGTEHRKYLRQIFVSLDITAPFYWWKEFDTYKVGTVANSCSTMHKIAAKEFVREDFSLEHLAECNLNLMDMVINNLNLYRSAYLESKNKEDWWQLIQLLPTSYNQKRTITMNYENVFTILRQRKGHKLDEWNELWEILHDLPYIAAISEDSDHE
jgi:hypothetical protein